MVITNHRPRTITAVIVRGPGTDLVTSLQCRKIDIVFRHLRCQIDIRSFTMSIVEKSTVDTVIDIVIGIVNRHRNFVN